MTVILLDILADVVPRQVGLRVQELVVLLARIRGEPAPLHFFCRGQVAGAEVSVFVGKRAEPVGQLGSGRAEGRVAGASLRLALLLVDLLEGGGLGGRHADRLQVIEAVRVERLHEGLVKSLSHGLVLLRHVVTVKRVRCELLRLLIP